MKNKTKNWLLIIAVILLAIIPLLFVKGEFGGSDDAGKQAINAIVPAYHQWVKPLMEPPAEIETLLFSLQAALGAGFIGYIIGLYKGKSMKGKEKE